MAHHLKPEIYIFPGVSPSRYQESPSAVEAGKMPRSREATLPEKKNTKVWTCGKTWQGGGLVNYWMFRFEWCFLVKLNVVSFVVWVFFCFGFGYYVSFVTLCSSIYACMCSICLGISLGIPYGLRHFELNWVLVLLPIGLPIGLLGKCWGTPIQRTGNNLWSEAAQNLILSRLDLTERCMCVFVFSRSRL